MMKTICVIPANRAIFLDRKAMGEIQKATQEKGGFVTEYSDIGQYVVWLPDNSEENNQIMYVLQIKECTSKHYVIGNHSYPYPTYRWKDVAISESKEALEEMKISNFEYRIDEREFSNDDR